MFQNISLENPNINYYKPVNNFHSTKGWPKGQELVKKMPTQHIRDPHLLFFFLGPLVLPFIGVWVPAVHVQEFLLLLLLVLLFYLLLLLSPVTMVTPPPSPWLLMLLLLLLLLLFLFCSCCCWSLINDPDSISRTFLERFVLVFSSHWLTRAPPKSLWKGFVKLDQGFCADASLSHFNQQRWCSLRRAISKLVWSQFTKVGSSWPFH